MWAPSTTLRRPVAAVDRPVAGVGQAAGWVWGSGRDGGMTEHHACPVALVVAEAEDVEVVRVAGVLILKLTVWPALTLIEVAKPWMVESPAPLTCQSSADRPARCSRR